MHLEPWPSWHNDQFIYETDLLGLEDYLRTRVALAARDVADGVIEFDPWGDVELRRSTGEQLIAVKRVRGLTPAGSPVVAPPSGLFARCPPLTEEPFPLSVVVNSRSTGDNRPAKLELVAVDPTPQTDTLHLGFYKFGAGGDLTCQSRPRAVYLASFRLDSNVGASKWQACRASVAEAIRMRVEDLRSSKPVVPEYRDTATAELHRLAFEWPLLTVPELARRFHLVRWLAGVAAGGSDDPTDLPFNPLAELRTCSGEEIPSVVVRYLTGGESEQNLITYEVDEAKHEIVATFRVSFPNGSAPRLVVADNGAGVGLVCSLRHPKDENNRWYASTPAKQGGRETVYQFQKLPPPNAGEVWRFRPAFGLHEARLDNLGEAKT